MIAASLFVAASCCATSFAAEPRPRAQEDESRIAPAIQQYERGEKEAALAAFESLAEGAPHGTILAIADYLCLRKRDYDAGRSYAQRCHEQGTAPEHSNAWLTTLLLTGKTLQVEKECRALLERFPDNEPLLFQLGLSLHRQQKETQALEIFLPLVEREPEKASYRYGLADVLLTMRREKEAEVHFRKVLELEPNNRGAACRLGETLSFLGRDAEAEQVFVTAIRQGNREAGCLYGKFLFQRDRFEDALFYFKRWTKENPDSALAWSYLGRCQLQLKRPKAAKKALEKFRELDRRNIETEDADLLRIIRMHRADREKAEKEGGDEEDGSGR